MSTSFNPSAPLIVVMARISGPSAGALARLALDTGATATLSKTGLLRTIGYDPAASPDRVTVTTGSRVEHVSRVVLDRIEVLGQVRTAFPVLSHTLPPSATVDGLLGLDFLRGQTLTIDFRTGQITLA